MAVTLVENGKDLCSVAAFRIHSGAREVIDVPVLGGGGFTVPGRKDADRVSFTIPIGKLPHLQGYAQHALRDDQGNSRAILITSISGGAAGVLVEAIVQP